VDLFNLAKELINIPSLSGDEGGLADFLGGRLKSRGLAVAEQVVEGRRKNIWATPPGIPPRVVLCTHLDTVPPYFGASEDEKYIYGRGACDAKGILAAMIQAAMELKSEGPFAWGLLFLAGEETDNAGARKANALEAGSEFIIVGEPTENKLGRGHKGFLGLKVMARGKRAHSAYPGLGESAIDRLLDVLHRIRALEFDEDPLMGDTTLNIGRIEGGVAANVVADEAWAEISLRNALPSRTVLDKIRAVAGRHIEVEVFSASEPQPLFTVPGFETAVLSFGTDVPYLQGFGRPLLLGPGSILDAHSDQEKIEKSQLQESVGIYKMLVKRLLSERGPEGAP
jgi:acetylornithine deacetylase